MPRAAGVLIAAASGRALAASARRGGYVPLVADFFGDQDTPRQPTAHVRLDQGLARGMRRDNVIAALESLAARREADRDRLRHRVRGSARTCSPASRGAGRCWATHPPWSRARKTRSRFAKLCRDCGIAHPDIRPSPPPDPENWLAKRQGGAGGQHIRDAADDAMRTAATFYFQRRVDGVAGVRPLPRRRSSRHDPRLQRAMVGAHSRAALPLWRRRAAGRLDAEAADAMTQDGRAAHRGDAAGRLEQRRFSCRRHATIESVGDQSAAGRDARHLRTDR